MENAGCVTFNDLYVFKEEVDVGRLARFANTIVHELIHHWFGNLVTMKWWNDLWLNESFADFISYFCMSKLTITTKPFPHVWAMANQRKGWGYATDQKITTHPIAGDVANTEAAESIFDGITYAKGAATLRQLLALVGEDLFSNAMGNYFGKFAWNNATLDDFINSIDIEFRKKNFGFSLAEWQTEWITKAGLNEALPVFDPESRSEKSVLTIQQGVALQEHPTLRRHKVHIAFFKKDLSFDEK